MKDPVSIEIYSDVVCPWCFIGKRRVEQALERIREQYAATMPVWRAFQLNPDLPAEGVARKEYVEQKFGGAQRAKEIYARLILGARLIKSETAVIRGPINTAFDYLIEQASTLGDYNGDGECATREKL